MYLSACVTARRSRKFVHLILILDPVFLWPRGPEVKCVPLGRAHTCPPWARNTLDQDLRGINHYLLRSTGQFLQSLFEFFQEPLSIQCSRYLSILSLGILYQLLFSLGTLKSRLNFSHNKC